MPYTSFFFNDTATTEIYTLSLHDALPISTSATSGGSPDRETALLRTSAATTSGCSCRAPTFGTATRPRTIRRSRCRSEEHTSELQSRQYLVCRLLLEKKNEREPQRNVHM